MAIYFSLLLFMIAAGIFGGLFCDEKKRRIITVILCGLALFLIQALRRPTVGVDLQVYLPAFDLSPLVNVFKGEKLSNFEPGFTIFLQLCAELGLPHQVFLALVAAIVIVPVSWIWYRYSDIPFLSAFIYTTFIFYTFTFSGLRQAIALAICFGSYHLVRERKLLPFCLLILLAATFHRSALISLALYPLYAVRFRGRATVVLFGLLGVVFIFRNSIWNLVYQLYKKHAAVFETTNAYSMLLILAVVLIASYFLTGDGDEEIKPLQNYLLVAAMIQIFATVSNSAMRAGYYYLIYITLLIPAVIHRQKSAGVRIFGTMGTVAALTFFYYWTELRTGYLDIVPYEFFWQ